jgi:excisionase family DNA binding protein
MPDPQILPPLIVSVDEACRMLSLCRTVMYEEIKSGRIKSFKRGKSRLITVASLHEWIAAMSAEKAGV